MIIIIIVNINITDMLKKAGNYLLQKPELGVVKKGFH